MSVQKNDISLIFLTYQSVRNDSISLLLPSIVCSKLVPGSLMPRIINSDVLATGLKSYCVEVLDMISLGPRVFGHSRTFSC